MECQGLSLHKGAFRDALSLRYGWQPSNLPSKCVCGKSFNVDHALNCSTGGFPTIRHNEIRDFTAKLLTEVCHDVCVEPPLQALSGEHLPLATANREDNARLDVRQEILGNTTSVCLLRCQGRNKPKSSHPDANIFIKSTLSVWTATWVNISSTLAPNFCIEG